MTLNPPPSVLHLESLSARALRRYLHRRNVPCARSMRGARLLALALQAREQHTDDYASEACALMTFAMTGDTPERDLPIPAHGTITKGWDIHITALQVFPAWSGQNHHGRGVYSPHRTCSQGGRALYSTREAASLALAVCAMRAAVDKIADALTVAP